uniref:Protein male-specific lethal-3 n=1 Tax=Strigamia maritima TaxID=126957 RepID=T1J3G3_STRMM
MKMVSTRGVKFKFEKSETVLCYEPDPTKAKVLYESKVLGTSIRKDKCGRKIPEYRVHFNGWNSSWDRFVPEELMLEDNEENRDLQQLLAQQAIVKLKSNKKRRLIEALLTDKRNGRNKRNMGQVIQLNRQKERPKRTNSNAKLVNCMENLLRIPEALKRQLENDFLFIKNDDKLVRLPSQLNVIVILEDYVQTYIQNSFQSSTKSENHDDCDKRLNLCKEVVDGLRIYFDFTLSNLLLYNSEIKQYEYYTTHFKSECINIRRNLFPTCDTTPHSNNSVKQITKQSNLLFDGIKQLNNSEHEETCIVHVLDSGSTQEIMDSSLQADICNAQSSHLTLKSDDDFLLDQTIPLKSDDDSLLDRTIPLKSDDDSLLDRTIPLKSDDSSLLDKTIPIERNSCSSDKSTKNIESPVTAPASTSILKHLSQRFYDSSLIRCRHCQEALNWSLLPSSVYDNEIPSPSLIYGAHHLLRLFVKLPELLSRSNMPPKKLRLLGKHLQAFLRYLDDKREELFHESDYVDFKNNFDTTDSALVR